MTWANMTREERIEAMKPLTRDGHSASDIGRELGTTKNAIIGLWHRRADQFDFPSNHVRRRHRPDPSKHQPTPKPKAIRQPWAPAAIEVEMPEIVDKPPPAPAPKNPPVVRPVIVAALPPTGPGVSILDRRIGEQCGWVMPEPKDGLAMCCGEPIWRAGSSWCAYHAKRVYAAPGAAPAKRSPVRQAPSFAEAAE